MAVTEVTTKIEYHNGVYTVFVRVPSMILFFFPQWLGLHRGCDNRLYPTENLGKSGGPDTFLSLDEAEMITREYIAQVRRDVELTTTKPKVITHQIFHD